MEMDSIEDLIHYVETSNGYWFRYNDYQVRATVTDVRADLDAVVYKGCQKDCCMKKVRPQNDGWFYCPKCDRYYQHFKYRYKLKVLLEDRYSYSNGHLWCTMFDAAIPFLGKTASELVKIHRFGSEKQYHSIITSRVQETFDFKIRSAVIKLPNTDPFVNGIVEEWQSVI